MADQSFTLWKYAFSFFDLFCSCDLDPMTFIYELNPYSMMIYRMCKYEFLTSRLSKFIVWQTYKQTDTTEIIHNATFCHVCEWSIILLLVLKIYNYELDVLNLKAGHLSHVRRSSSHPQTHVLTLSRIMYHYFWEFTDKIWVTSFHLTVYDIAVQWTAGSSLCWILHVVYLVYAEEELWIKQILHHAAVTHQRTRNQILNWHIIERWNLHFNNDNGNLAFLLL